MTTGLAWAGSAEAVGELIGPGYAVYYVNSAGGPWITLTGEAVAAGAGESIKALEDQRENPDHDEKPNQEDDADRSAEKFKHDVTPLNLCSVAPGFKFRATARHEICS